MSAGQLSRMVVAGASGTTVWIGGKQCDNFCGDDFLGLAGDRRIQAAIIGGLEQWGEVGPATPENGGYSSYHERLELQLSVQRQSPSCVLFPSYLHACKALLSTIRSEQDLLLYDAGVHPLLLRCSVDSAGKMVSFVHNDLASLEQRLRGGMGARSRLVLVESLYWLSGEVSSLVDLVELSQEFAAQLIVDETSAFGLLGEGGAGGMERAGLLRKDLLTLCGFDRVIGATGAAVFGPKLLSDRIRESVEYQSSPTLPVVCCAQLSAAVEIAQHDSTSRARIRVLASRLRSSLQEMGYRVGGSSFSPIIPIVVDTAERADKLARALFERGIFVATGMLPPVGSTAGATGVEVVIRLTVSAKHTDAQCASLLQAFADIGKRIGVFK